MEVEYHYLAHSASSDMAKQAAICVPVSNFGSSLCPAVRKL